MTSCPRNLKGRGLASDVYRKYGDITACGSDEQDGHLTQPRPVQVDGCEKEPDEGDDGRTCTDRPSVIDAGLPRRLLQLPAVC